MTVSEKQQQLIDDYGLIENPQERLGAVVDAARQIPRFTESERSDDNLVPGCQSRVWLIGEFHDGRCRFRTDCDSPMVAGLVALQTQPYHDSVPDEIAAHPPRVLEELGLLRDLTPTRQNGLAAVHQRVVAFARSNR